MYYTVEIGSPLFFQDISWSSDNVFFLFFPCDFQDVLDVDLSSLLIVGEPTHRV
jgi:hypothetical protein